MSQNRTSGLDALRLHASCAAAGRAAQGLRGPAALAVALGLFSAILRLPRVFSSPFWQDEVASARILREPNLSGALHHVTATESTPPLWYVLGWAAYHLGVPLQEVRLISVFANGLLVTLVVVFARRLMPLGFALVAGALVALGGEFSAQGRWIRAYELFALLAVVFAFVLAQAAQEASLTAFARVAAATAAGGLTHYFFFFTILTAVAWIALDRQLRAVRRRLILAILCGVAPLAIWVPSFVRQFEQARYSWIGAVRWRLVLETPLLIFTPLLRGAAGIAAALIVIAVFASGCIPLWRQLDEGRLCVVLAAGPWVIASLAWAAGVNVYAVRNMIAIGPFIAIGISMALAALRRPTGTILASALLSAAAAAFAFNQRTEGPPFNALARALIAQGWQRGNPVVVFGTLSEFRSPLEWYLPAGTNLEPAGRPQVGTLVYVIGGGAAAARFAGVSLRHVDGFFVGRLRLGRNAERAGVVAGAGVLRSRPLVEQPSGGRDPS